ncbi:hypothetical protein [Celeribacter sp.]|uniref:hypothetical protein n=1 Tax=Celeribacter sp. TaxID=1890673 RepID=UPI003A9006C0
MKKQLYVSLSLGILMCLSPVAAILWASNFAAKHGCRLDEASAYACMVNGQDWGGTLGAAFLSGWLLLITLPAAGLFVIILIAVVLRDIRKRTKG